VWRARATVNPEEVLGALHPQGPGTANRNTRPGLPDTLGPAERAEVRALAARNLKQESALELERLRSAQATAEPWQLLRDTRQLQTRIDLVRTEINDTSLQPEVQTLEANAARRCLSRSVDESRALAEQGKWAEAGERAQARLQTLGKVPVETEPLERFVVLQQRAEALEHAGELLARPESALAPAAEVARLAPVKEGLGIPVAEYLKVSRLQGEATGAWDRPPDLGKLREGLDVLAASPETEPLAKQLANELAVKACLKGHPKEANALLDAAPGAGKPSSPDEQAAKQALLRDMKTVLLGEEGGKVQSWPAAEVVQPGSVDGRPRPRGPPPDPPPGARPLLPEGDAKGWRPPVVERATEGLPSPKEALDRPLAERRQNVETALCEATQGLKVDRQHVLSSKRPAEPFAAGYHLRLPAPFGATVIIPEIPRHLPAPNQAGPQDDEEDARLIAQVEQLLGRPLTPAEKMTAKRLRRGGLDSQAIAENFANAAVQLP
jgi:hypothetical protein